MNNGFNFEKYDAALHNTNYFISFFVYKIYRKESEITELLSTKWEAIEAIRL